MGRKDYSQAYIIGLLTMIPLAIPLIQNIAFTVITAQNKLKFRTIVYAVIAVLNVIGTILAMPKIRNYRSSSMYSNSICCWKWNFDELVLLESCQT